MSVPSASLGFLKAQLVPRPDWLSKRIPERYLELSTCEGKLEPDALPLSQTFPLPSSGSQQIRDDQLMIELGLSKQSLEVFQNESDLAEISLLPSPTGTVLGYVVLVFEWSGYGWHSQNCNNMPDDLHSRDLVFNTLGLIDNERDAFILTDWMNDCGAKTEPGPWITVSVHEVNPTRSLNP
ncbi:hypothetical protein MF271_09490 [Deinococcus sp. KNUC1210]|uniref:hypothetical protein n=1 Tax=Deinococcus sp. KNUC1210 TaxID=2917691 RepID=UPI001EF0AB51|nr:hypothetical protein [Deinococcus sp. KNUC1210]ULH16775.1 hypothetical protein MF271_09490 [Deinococcus sp. KNUC1210]